ncbi:pentatricopeptide repeat protein [Actinopolyspora biskrensis]|uniref:Pentatricopeptide repeat protein n=1 Tax=Actinopolyspora biskrensis TaxID=1470178 RepID=A0A852YRY1_9ACTN|nr:pentatricopeptide repeat protein [Actinopolyspora biskrensis]
MIEQLVDLDITLGRHDRIIGELRALTAEFPLRERLCTQLITALGRSGRRAEAVRVFRSSWEHVVSEAGIEPSRDLDDAFHGALADDPRVIPQWPPYSSE